MSEAKATVWAPREMFEQADAALVAGGYSNIRSAVQAEVLGHMVGSGRIDLTTLRARVDEVMAFCTERRVTAHDLSSESLAGYFTEVWLRENFRRMTGLTIHGLQGTDAGLLIWTDSRTRFKATWRGTLASIWYAKIEDEA